jgi:hypothetical protein
MEIIQQKTREQLLLLLTQENPEATKPELENFIDRICLLSLSLIKKFFNNK